MNNGDARRKKIRRMLAQTSAHREGGDKISALPRNHAIIYQKKSGKEREKNGSEMRAKENEHTYVCVMSEIK